MNIHMTMFGVTANESLISVSLCLKQIYLQRKTRHSLM